MYVQKGNWHYQVKNSIKVINIIQIYSIISSSSKSKQRGF